MTKLFDKIGIYGMPVEQENALLASLLTGDPTLLIGKQGTAKTALVSALGAAMHESTRRKYPNNPEKWITHHAYDASKINFEDLIGIPNVDALKEGRMEFTRSPMTAWDKDIITFDEFNRQLPERQNNIFELVRSRTLMGMPTKMKWCFNCMNPFGMAGTEELDEALVDRHAWFIYVNSFDKLNNVNKMGIVQHIGQHDAPALKHFWNAQEGQFDFDKDSDGINETLADAGDDIFRIMEKAAEVYQELRKEVGKAYASFIARFVSALDHEQRGKDWKVELSGRRAGMIHRAALSYRAVQLAKSEIYHDVKLPTLKESFNQFLAMTIPAGISQASAAGMDPNAMNSIRSNIEVLGEFFQANGSQNMIAAVDTMYELVTTTSLSRKIEILVNEVSDEHTKSQVWSDILNPRKKSEGKEKIRRDILINIVAHLCTVRPDCVPQSFQKQIIKEAAATDNMRSLFRSLTLVGAASFFAEQVEEHLRSIDSPFAKLQAKLIYEDELSGKEYIDNKEFFQIREKVKSECASLQSLIISSNIADIDSVDEQQVVESKKDNAEQKERTQNIVENVI